MKNVHNNTKFNYVLEKENNSNYSWGGMGRAVKGMGTEVLPSHFPNYCQADVAMMVPIEAALQVLENNMWV